jgi:O-antigen ligase
LNNPIPTGLFIAVALCYWLRLLLFGSWRIFLLVLPVLGLAGFGLILTNSKGPLLGALVGLVLVLVIPFVMRPHLRSRVFIITVLLVAAFVLSVLGTARSDRPALMGVPDAFQEYTHPGEHPGTSGGLRIQMLDYGYSVIKAHPILGTGPGAASRYMSEDLDLHGGRGDRVTLHNTYLLAAVTLGIPGLLLLLWVLMAALWSAAPLAARTGFLGGTFYGLVVWIVAAVGDSYQGSGNFMGILGFLITIGLLGAPLHTTEPCLEAR